MSDVESDGGDELEVEKQAKRLAAEAEQEKEDADAELQTNIMGMRKFTLPSGQTIEHGAEAPDMSAVMQRIQDVLFVLSDFAKHKQPDRDRVDYVRQLRDDMANYFSYLPELIDRFLQLFSPLDD